jgi:hypothetical protein
MLSSQEVNKQIRESLTFPRRDFSGHLCTFPTNVQ